METLSSTILLGLFCSQVFGFKAAVEFDLPQSIGNAYTGQLFRHESSVTLFPRLRAFTNKGASQSNKICGFHPIVKDKHQFPFDVDLKDTILGTGEIRLRNEAPVEFTQNRMYKFQIEAYDCDSPPNYSERIPVNIYIRADEQLRFTEGIYNFSVVSYTSVGVICGKVTVIHASSTPPINDQDHQCGYSILAGDMVPFTVDSHGIIRTREVLTNAFPRNFRFPVQYKDCDGARFKSVTTIVNIKVIQGSCEPKWNGLPSSLYYSLSEQQPKRLLWPPSYSLDMCGMTCNEDDSHIFTQVKLLHGLPGATLNTASAAFCRHDPHSLLEQNKLCAMDSATLVDLLPDPRKNILHQHIVPAVGALPEVVPLSLGMRFSSAAGSGWHLDTSRLIAAAYVGSEGRSNKVLGSTLFESNFTLSFWFQHDSKPNNDHETFLCSQEDTATVGRALWISQRNCQIMVQMTTDNPQSSEPRMNKIFRTYVFPQLPPSVCQVEGQRDRGAREMMMEDEGSPFAWHHYFISVSFDPQTAELTTNALIVDGQMIGTLEAFGEPVYVSRSSSEFFTQFITVGTCYDPNIPGSQQSLNGALAGMSLLLGRNEDQSVSLCLAACGEGLLIQRASRLITDDVTVLLNNDKIVIESRTNEKAVELLSNIAYTKPQSTSTQLTYEPAGTNTRSIELATVFRCGSRQLGNISTAFIPLTLEGFSADGVATTMPLDSAWIPENEMIVPAAAPVSASAPLSPLVLAVLGQETVRAEIPVQESGILMFPSLEFTFTNVPSHRMTVTRSASMFILDRCLVLPVDGSELDFDHGERIVWPEGRAYNFGVSVDSQRTGVLMTGRQTASQYASLLGGFRYRPPIEIEKRANDKALALGQLLERKFQLTCAYNDAGFNTEPFTVQIILSSPVIAEETRAGMNVVYSDNSRYNLDGAAPIKEDYIDDDDDDENYDKKANSDLSADGSIPLRPYPWPPAKKLSKRLEPSPPYRSEMRAAQFAQSDMEIRPIKSLSLHHIDKSQNEAETSSKNRVLAIGLGVGSFAVVILVVAFLISKSNGSRHGRLSLSRRAQPESLERLHFHPETRLHVIDNPIEKMEKGRLNWQPPVVATIPIHCGGIPGVHAAYGTRDEQFDAETRSFNGLFEEDENDAGANAAAALEEVDDFDDTEAAVSQHLDRVSGEVKEDEEDLSGLDDDEETSFSVGPNHLDYVTLPAPLRSFNAHI